MARYVALLRGISPTNPNMRNEKLRGVFEGLGFTKVETVISSGNVIFESSSESAKALEGTIEKAIVEKLGFTSAVIVRSQQEIQHLVDQNPFKGVIDAKPLYLITTFFKQEPELTFKLPHRPKDKPYKILHMQGGAISSVIDLTDSKTPDFMTWLEKQWGKGVTTRTWKTVNRIRKKLSDNAK